jgi:homoserine O-acetyltransferase
VGDTGWWNDLIGVNKTIDTTIYCTYFCFGNGFDGAVIENYLDFTARDIARIFIKAFNCSRLQNSTPLLEFCRWRNLGNGRIRTNNNPIILLLPIGSYRLAYCQLFCKNKFWIIHLNLFKMHAHICCVIELQNLLRDKFQRTTNEELAILMLKVGCIMAKNCSSVFNWLPTKWWINYWKQLILLAIVFVWKYNQTVEAEIHIIAINSVCFFASENKATFEIVQNRIKKVSYQEIVSIHGHDAFDRIQTITFAGYFLKLKYTTQWKY